MHVCSLNVAVGSVSGNNVNVAVPVLIQRLKFLMHLLFFVVFLLFRNSEGNI